MAPAASSSRLSTSTSSRSVYAGFFDPLSSADQENTVRRELQLSAPGSTARACDVEGFSIRSIDESRSRSLYKEPSGGPLDKQRWGTRPGFSFLPGISLFFFTVFGNRRDDLIRCRRRRNLASQMHQASEELGARHAQTAKEPGRGPAVDFS